MSNSLIPVRRGPPGPPGPPGTAVTGGRTLYLSNTGGSPPDYEGLSLLPDANPEDVMTASGIVALDGDVLLQGPDAPSVWITEIEVPGIEIIDAGVWTVKLFAAATAGNGASCIRFKLYKATADLATETLLLTWADSASLPTTVGSTAIDVEAIAGIFDIDVTDRLVLRAYARTTSTVPVDVSLYHSGTTHYTRLLSPIVAATVYSDLLPLSGGTAHPGVQNVASRGDHRHAHGIIGGGSTHALAVANGSAGYISGANQAKLDGIEALADVTTFAKVNAALAGANASISINGQKITNVGAPSASTDADTLIARNTAIAAAFNVTEAVASASPATSAQVIIDVVFSFRVVSNAVVALASYDMVPGTSVAIFADVQSFTEGTHANQQVHVIVASGKRTSAGTSSRTSASGGGGSGQVVNDFGVPRPALSVSDPNSNVSPNVQHRLALLYTGKSGVNTIVMGTARILIGRVT